jgi:hypothetical protein
MTQPVVNPSVVMKKLRATGLKKSGREVWLAACDLSLKHWRRSPANLAGRCLDAHQARQRPVGFGDVPTPGVRVCTSAQIAVQQDLFFDMRHASRAFEQLAGESVRQFAEEQYDRGWHLRRKNPRKVKIIGDRGHGRILLVDVKETNGHTVNGRLEAAL